MLFSRLICEYHFSCMGVYYIVSHFIKTHLWYLAAPMKARLPQFTAQKRSLIASCKLTSSRVIAPLLYATSTPNINSHPCYRMVDRDPNFTFINHWLNFRFMQRLRGRSLCVRRRCMNGFFCEVINWMGRNRCYFS